MKTLFLLISAVFLLVRSAEVNETKRSTDGQVLQSNPEPLVDLDKLKNSTKDAADRIFKLITSSKETDEILATTTEKSDGFKPLFSSHHSHHSRRPSFNAPPFSIFGLHKSSAERPIKSFEERLCTCPPEFSIPTLPTYSGSSASSAPSSDFNSNVPTFEVVYPSSSASSSRDFFPSSIETPIISQYPPLDLSNLWQYQDSSLQSSSLNDNL